MPVATAEAAATSAVDSLRLPESFLSRYKGRQPRWGFDGLGYIIYLRTYSRKKPDGTREDWWETVRRFTEGNFNIEWERRREIGAATPEAREALRREMERFYELAFNLLILPPGRGIWMSGTDYDKRSGDALNNCWGIACRPYPYAPGEPSRVSYPFAFVMDQAMKGGGVGVNIQRRNTSQIPPVKSRVNLKIVCSPNHPDFANCLPHVLPLSHEPAGEEWIDRIPENLPKHLHFRIPDSREGWVMALRLVIDGHFDGLEELVLDISDIRPKGSDIRGFGGTASGPAPLAEMLVTVNRILNEAVGRRLTPVECGDIIQNEGKCVVSGNVRRTALILIGDEDDRDFIESKNYALKKNAGAWLWRWTSNNSIDIRPDSPRETMLEMARNIYYNGEPGYVNMHLARHFGRIIDGFREDIDGEVEVFNPCGEIGLASGENCNLFEVNLPRIHEWIKAGLADESLYREALTLAARYAYRVTFRKYEWEITRDIIGRNRRIGVGITGITDWILLKFGRPAVKGFLEDGSPIFDAEIAEELDRMYGFVREANRRHAEELKAAPSLKVTTVKPSGTISILMGCAPGMHHHWSGYFIRRVRFAKNNELVPVLEACGYPVEPAILGSEEGKTVYDENTVVISFPVKAPTADHPLFRASREVPLREQAAFQELLATYWSDNAVSATLTFHKGKTPEEDERVIREIADVLDRAKRVIKSTTLLPHSSETYPQMPYEAITKEQYLEMAGRIKARPWEILRGSVSFGTDDADEAECAGGHCPIK